VLVVGLGNPGSKYAGSRHNAGAEVADELARRWELPRARQRYRGRIADGRAGPGGPRVSVLVPETFMNESGDSVAPARGSLKIGPDRVVVLHDEIDLPFGEIQSRLGGGLAGHNGLRSVSRGLGGPDFWRVRVGVGRPDSTDPEIVSAHVLGRFSESDEEVRELIAAAADEAEGLVRRLGEEDRAA
jgi:peptidyl-tRNA hydrolase, PTH1 family